MKHTLSTISRALIAAAAVTTLAAVPAQAQRYQQELRHSAVPCQGDGPAVMLNVTGVRGATGTMRIQLYRGTADDWLESGRWLYRIEMPAREGTMSICMPAPAAGDYAIAIRHDVNANGRTDISSDGGGMSNNPSFNVFNLGRPNISRTRFTLASEVLPMTIRMRYL